MKTQMRDILKITSVYIASTIGAAFASGQEIVRFFTRFEAKSFPGVLVAGVLFSLVAIAVLDIVYSRKIDNSRELLHLLGGPYAGRFFEVLSIFFTFCIYIVMIAGAAALWHRLTGLSLHSGIILLTLFSTILIFFNIEGVLAISELLTPLMIGGMLYLGLTVIIRTQPVFSLGITKISNNWMVYAFLYVCYNSILNILVMSSMRPWLSTWKTVVISGTIGGTALFLAMYVLNHALYVNFQAVHYAELPMIELSVVTGKWGFILYSLVLTFALLTTAISSGFCCVERMSQIINKPRWVLNTCMGLLVIPLAKQGFSNMIDKVYPVFGYLGSLLFFLLLFHWIKMLCMRITGLKTHLSK